METKEYPVFKANFPTNPPEGSSHYVHKDKPSPLCKNLPGTKIREIHEQLVQGSNPNLASVLIFLVPPFVGRNSCD